MTAEILKNMLDDPLVPDGKPDKFDSQAEAEYLETLIKDCDALQAYQFDKFIAAGGSGMVFRVKRKQDSFPTALKIVRKKGFEDSSQSPFSNEELDALKELSHANILRIYEFVEKADSGVVGICSAYISNPQGMDKYVQGQLEPQESREETQDTYSQISPERLNKECNDVFNWFYQVAQALAYMHGRGYYHMDIKPANILIHGQDEEHCIPIIADMGSCINGNLQKEEEKRAHFTWTYAHPELQNSNPGSLEGFVRASADIVYEKLPAYDLFALGRTIQKILAVIRRHFGEMSFSNDSFRYLHVIAALLLDGKNRSGENVIKEDGIIFADDCPMEVRVEIFNAKKITLAAELVERLKRHSREYSIAALAEEFELRNPHIINNTVDMVPFSTRVSKVFNHPTLKRLYGELQLGLMTEVYPGASHNRWSHSVGVYSMMLKYYIALLSDRENPLVRIVINKSDINHALMAAILHDIGQTAFCHDLEAANKELFDHVSYFDNLISETSFCDASLKDTILEAKDWGDIDFKRVLSIIKGIPEDPVDHIASDAINGPIDADKLDYIRRDSYYCGVSYGDGIDYNRFLNALTVYEQDRKIRLTYYTKGRTAISSMLLARYQLYGSVYWHHTYRCLNTMLHYVVLLAFRTASNDDFKVTIMQRKYINMRQLRALYYHRVYCKLPWKVCWEEILKISYANLKPQLREESKMFADDYALDFLYRFSDDNGRKLLKCLYERNIFKRIYTKSLYSVNLRDLDEKCKDRVKISREIQNKLFHSILDKKMSKFPESAAEQKLEEELVKLKQELDSTLYVLVDYPTKIKVPENNWPTEIGDSSRKMLHYYEQEISKEILISSNRLLNEVACLRVYASPTFFSIITRYLTPHDIESCIKNVISIL